VRDWREAPARGRARVRSVCARAHVRLGATFDMAARADFWPVSGCDSCVRWSGPENVTNSAAAARNGQSGICRHRLEDESSMDFYSASVGAITSEFLSSKKRSEPKNRRILVLRSLRHTDCRPRKGCLLSHRIVAERAGNLRSRSS
jgi:hypothetical protein